MFWHVPAPLSVADLEARIAVLRGTAADPAVRFDVVPAVPTARLASPPPPRKSTAPKPSKPAAVTPKKRPAKPAKAAAAAKPASPAPVSPTGADSSESDVWAVAASRFKARAARAAGSPAAAAGDSSRRRLARRALSEDKGEHSSEAEPAAPLPDASALFDAAVAGEAADDSTPVRPKRRAVLMDDDDMEE
jgi:hypothetical protein